MEECGKMNGIPCDQKKLGREKIGSWKERDIVYQSFFNLCQTKGKVSRYTGETARGLAERSFEHVNDAVKADEGSHKALHLVDQHQKWYNLRWLQQTS